MKRKKKCSFEGARFNPCWLMDERLLPEANDQRTGLVMVNVGTLQKPTRTIGVTHKKNSKDAGVMLNYCPWCGKNIEGWKKK